MKRKNNDFFLIENLKKDLEKTEKKIIYFLESFKKNGNLSKKESYLVYEKMIEDISYFYSLLGQEKKEIVIELGLFLEKEYHLNFLEKLIGLLLIYEPEESLRLISYINKKRNYYYDRDVGKRRKNSKCKY